MTDAAVPQRETQLPRVKTSGRVIGRVVGDSPGPTLICIGGMHGNEPAGVGALQKVFADLTLQRLRLKGEFLGLAGNLAGLAAGRRYIARDLNRLWTARRIGSTPEKLSDEEVEIAELVSELEAAFARAEGDVFILDIHTTSGPGAPFVLIGDTLRNRSFALRFPLPVVLGLDEYIDGTVSEYLTNAGHVTISLEAGQHDASDALDNAEAAVWMALVATGNVSQDDVPSLANLLAKLDRAAGYIPRVLEVIYRHPVTQADQFRMEPGFKSFDHVSPGQLLARDRHGPIRSRWHGRLLMPLYQDLGDDGFFIIREFSPAWLKLSAQLRRSRIDALAHWLPGIKRHPQKHHTLVVNRRVARWFALDLLHLLGYRRVRAVGEILLVSRRSHDLRRAPSTDEPPQGLPHNRQ